MSNKALALKIIIVMALLEACSLTAPGSSPAPSSQLNAPPALQNSATPNAALEKARAKIKHIVIIMQENRSFDSYFGTYPGADGIPTEWQVHRLRERPTTGKCIYPFHDPADKNEGGPHGQQCRHRQISTAAKWTALSPRPSRVRPAALLPMLLTAAAASTSWAITTHARSQITGALQSTLSCRIIFSSQMPPGACRSTSSWSRNGQPNAARPATR